MVRYICILVADDLVTLLLPFFRSQVSTISYGLVYLDPLLKEHRLMRAMWPWLWSRCLRSSIVPYSPLKMNSIKSGGENQILVYLHSHFGPSGPSIVMFAHPHRIRPGPWGNVVRLQNEALPSSRQSYPWSERYSRWWNGLQVRHVTAPQRFLQAFVHPIMLTITNQEFLTSPKLQHSVRHNRQSILNDLSIQPVASNASRMLVFSNPSGGEYPATNWRSGYQRPRAWVLGCYLGDSKLATTAKEGGLKILARGILEFVIPGIERTYEQIRRLRMEDKNST
jgi:hypothetical protein